MHKGDIYIIGSERSGSNLLRIILNTHPQIFVPHPPHIMKCLFPYENQYGDLVDDRNFVRLVDDTIRLISYHHYPWEVKLDKDDIFDRIQKRDLLNIFFTVYDIYQEYSGKPRWGCKSTFMIHHVDRVLHDRPDSKFIFLVRDPRDVCLSAKSSIFSHFSPYFTAQLWKKEQKEGIACLNRLPKDKIFLLKYEDFIQHSEKWIKDLCMFLEVDFTDKMLNYFETKEAKLSSGICQSWKNVSKAVMRTNMNKFKKGLLAEQIELIEDILYPEMKYFGYAFETDKAQREFRSGKLKYYIEEIFLAIHVQVKHLFIDENNSLRIKKFLFLKWLSVVKSKQ